MEFWDLYDENKNKINKVVKRGDKLEDNEYHLVVNAWIKNSENKFLISQRVVTKSHPLMWECTGGSVLSCESTLDAAVREIKEELGIDIDISTAKFVGSTLRYYPGCPDILDVWYFEDETPIEKVVFQEEEVCNVKWATPDEIRELYNNGKFEANKYWDEVISKYCS
ncbi:MAG: NUDIX domain-containing protein [Clostridia bacterium]|nr:NUDIX domain-containing protein [Clostridia bacterium]